MSDIFGLAGLAAAQQARSERPSYRGVLSRRAISGYATTAGVANLMYSTIAAMEAPFYAARVVWFNHLSTARTIDGSSIQVTAAVGDGVNPVDATGTYIQPARLTYSAFAAGVDVNSPLAMPPQVAAGGTPIAVTVPPALEYAANSNPSNVPGVAFSDWVMLNSLPRTDGGTLPLLIVKAWSGTDPLPNIGVQPGSVSTLDFDSVDQGRIWRSYVRSGGSDVTTNPTAITTGYSRNGNAHLYCAIQVLAIKRGFTIMADGDSLTAGQGSTGGQNNAGHQSASAVSTPELPVSFVSMGQPGALSLGLFTRAKMNIDRLRPDIIIIPAYSPNDGRTQATADASYARAMAVAEYARMRGAVTIITTPIPGAGNTAQQDVYRLSVRSRLFASGYLVADMEGLGTGATPNVLKPEYDSGDTTHLSNAGYAFQSGVLQPIVRRVIASRALIA